MKTKFLLYALLSLFCLLPLNASAEESVVEFFSDNATMEDDPNAQSYNITIFSPDGQWKMQLNYKSASMYGTFTNDDFNLSGSGKYYNYARNPNNDMVFYSFTDMNVTVSEESTAIRVKANCLANNNTRFIVEAVIGVPQAEQTITDNLGYARIEQNMFYGTWAIYAENDNYKLSYGVVGNSVLGTFYRADILIPELYDKKSGKQINVLTATAEHTKSGENTNLHIDIISDEKIQYSLSMFNGPYDIDITDEKSVEISDMVVQDLTSMYGCYQFGGINNDYGMAIAVKPEVLESGRRTWTRDDLIMQYTTLVKMPEQKPIDIFDINVTMESDGKDVTLKADVTCMDHTLYHVTMTSKTGGTMPEPEETVNIEMGHVSMLDFTQGMGVVGVGASVTDKYQMRFYLNTHDLEGDFSTSDFVMDMCDMMVVDGSTFVFHDGKYVNANMEKQADGTTRITVDMYCVNNVLYHATMYIDPLKAVEGGKYSLNLSDGIDMISIQATDGNYSEYQLQFQDIANLYDEDYNIVGDGSVFSFYFGHEGPGISGEYGYSAGTLAEDEIHTIIENNCEVRIAPVAGTLTIEALEPVTVEVPDFGTANTYLYKVSFKFVGQNSAIYEAEGQNILVCIDEDYNLIDMSETTAIIEKQLEEKGFRVRKVLKGGKIVIDTPTQQFDIQGRKVK